MSRQRNKRGARVKSNSQAIESAPRVERAGAFTYAVYMALLGGVAVGVLGLAGCNSFSTKLQVYQDLDVYIGHGGPIRPLRRDDHPGQRSDRPDGRRDDGMGERNHIDNEGNTRGDNSRGDNSPPRDRQPRSVALE